MATPKSEAEVKQGVDLEGFHEFVEHATEHPEDAQFELGARAIYEGRLFHSLAKVDAYSFGGENLETTVSLDFDPRVIFMIHDVDQSDETFDDIRVDIEVSGDDLSDEDAEILTAGAKRSPVWNLMRLPHDMEPVVSRASQSTED